MPVRMIDYKQEETAVYVTRTEIHDEQEHRWRTNHSIVVAYHGIVFVSRYRQEMPNIERTNMRFVWNGREYWRSWPKFWGDKTVTRLAREMVEEIVEAEE